METALVKKCPKGLVVVKTYFFFNSIKYLVEPLLGLN